jgi:hypothetical protein
MPPVDTFDEVLLKLITLCIRFFQLFSSLFIVGAVAQFLNDISGGGYVPGGYVAAKALRVPQFSGAPSSSF